MSKPFSCICAKVIYLPENQQDVKCANCGRVYTYLGRFLWREAKGNDLPGSTPIEYDRRAEEQEEAMIEAFITGTLPEEDRRASEPEEEFNPDLTVDATESGRARKK